MLVQRSNPSKNHATPGRDLAANLCVAQSLPYPPIRRIQCALISTTMTPSARHLLFRRAASRRFILYAALLSISIVNAASGQDVLTLSPDRYQVSAGAAVDLRLAHDGAGGSSVLSAWPEERIEWLFVRVAGTQENLHTVPAGQYGENGVTAGRLRMGQAGIALVGVDLRPRIEPWQQIDLLRFQRERIGSFVATNKPRLDQKRNATVSVRRLESIKLLLRVVDEKGNLRHSADAQSKSGQRAEIRPLADPTAVRLNRDLPVRVYLPLVQKSGILVVARHAASGKEHSFRTGPSGTGHFTIDEAGVWCMGAHSVRRLKGDPDADWEVCSATLTFEVPAVPDEKGED